MNIVTTIILFSMIILGIRCTEVGVASNGGGNDSGIDNYTIMGKLYNPDGITPASNVVVDVRYRNSTVAISSTDTLAAEELYKTHTDSSGCFKFDTVNAGLYVIEGHDNKGNMALYDSIAISGPLIRLNLPDDTLKPSGQITGVVQLSGGGNYGQVFVLAFGVQRFCQVQANGSFIMEGFAEGTYRLKYLSLESRYQSFDTSGILVKSGETTWLDTVTLTENGTLPVPQDLVADNGSVLNQVRLTWAASPASITQGYNIYRKFENCGYWGEIPEEGIRLNSELVTGSDYLDTMTQDLFIIKKVNSIVRYYVTMVDTNGMESVGSEDVVVPLRSEWELIDSTVLDVPDGFSRLDMVIDNENQIHIIDNDLNGEKQYYRLNSNDETLITWQLPDSIQKYSYVKIVDVGKNNSIWVLTAADDTGYIADSQWHPLRQYLIRISGDGTMYSTFTHDSLVSKEVVGTPAGASISRIINNCLIGGDSLLYYIYRNKLQMINMNNGTFQTLLTFNSSIRNSQLVKRTGDNLIVFYLENGMDNLVELAPSGNKLQTLFQIDCYYACGTIKGIQQVLGGGCRVYYESDIVIRNPDGSQTNVDMPPGYVLNDGTFFKFESEDKCIGTSCTSKTIFLRFRNTNY